MTDPTVHFFSKPDCVYCRTTKRALDQAGIPYDQHDVTADARTADTAAYHSGQHTVPQVFVGSTWIDAPGDVTALADAGRLTALVDAVTTPVPWDGLPHDDDATADRLARGAEDVPLHASIEPSDGTHDEDPESWPILRFYREFFGFWPNTFAYLHRWPTAYKLFVYCQNLASVRGAVDVVGHGGMAAIGYATSAAQGCTYCMTHAVADAGTDLDVPAALSDARRHGGADGAPIGPFEAALADLAARATRHAVTTSSLDAARRTAPEARAGAVDPDAAIEAATQVAASFGFLNVFNDLGGLEIEGDWAATAAARGVDAGRHGVGAANADNLSHDLPEGGPGLEDMLAGYAAQAPHGSGLGGHPRPRVPRGRRGLPRHPRARCDGQLGRAGPAGLRRGSRPGRRRDVRRRRASGAAPRLAVGPDAADDAAPVRRGGDRALRPGPGGRAHGRLCGRFPGAAVRRRRGADHGTRGGDVPRRARPGGGTARRPPSRGRRVSTVEPLVTAAATACFALATGLFMVLAFLERPVRATMRRATRASVPDADVREVHAVLRRLLHQLPPTMMSVMGGGTLLVVAQAWQRGFDATSTAVLVGLVVGLGYLLSQLRERVAAVALTPSDGLLDDVRTGLGRLVALHHVGLATAVVLTALQLVVAAR
ncbi:glutaredoxin domain-containing protein [Isoptericola halotolerans]|uniref:glutaredoxin family protein n=1 Tax=Isoptericola halotolerans TaxID=300560 RepID=UPI00389106AC